MRCIFLCAFRASRSLGSRRLSLHRSLVHWRSAGTMGEKTSHLERTAREPRERELIDVKLSQVKQVNDQVRLLRLSLPAPIKVLAGQWLDTYVPNTRGAGGFTITSSPSTAASPQDPYFELAVQKSPDNPHAAWIWQPPEEILNHRLQVRVGGSFVYPPGADFEDVKRVVLVGGGVGVNPLVSMMGEMADRRDDLEVDVLYGSKLPGGTLHEVLFLDRIAQMFRGGRLKGSVNVFLTETGDSTLGEIPEWLQSPSIALRKGRMSVQQVKNAISKGDSNETIVYICGPPAMTDGLAATVSQQDDGVIEARRVMTEKWW